MPKLLRVGILITLASAIAGCARFPSGTSAAEVREMSFVIEFNGPINDNYHYFVAIDTTGGGEGPKPIFPTIDALSGWLTGSATHYVEYTNRQYVLYRIVSLQPFASEPIGSPTRSTLPETNGTTLRFTIDLDTIGATGSSVDVNIIAVDQPFADIRLLDSLGLLGTQFLAEVDITTDRTRTNTDEGLPGLEGVQDVLDQNRQPAPDQLSDQVRPLDITGWSITVDV